MQKCHLYVTPSKQGDSPQVYPDTADFSQEISTTVDYKAKTFKLMKQLAEAEVTNKKSYTKIRQL